MHVEPTSRCTLACPGCPRTVISERLDRPYPKNDLDLDDFVKFLDCDSGHQLSNLYLEGNHGDPIYYPNLLDMIQTFRSKKFTLVTNGSFRDKKFWEALAARVTQEDWIIFSIDGLEHNNHLYRRNSDWNSIVLGLDIMRQSPANLGWKTIIFDYNYREIDRIRDFAESKGAVFVAQKTSRFGDESLRPPAEQVEFFREYTPEIEQLKDIDPQCDSHAKEYVAADGFYWPCCWISSSFTLPKSELWKQRSEWTIHDHTLDQMRSRLNDWIPNMRADPDTVCRMMCRPGNPRWPNTHGLT